MSEHPTLRFKATGAAVADLQALLIKAGYSLDNDGAFGGMTRAAVQDFQRKNRLAADGVVGLKTWAALEAAGEGAPAVAVPPPAEPLPDTGYAVTNDRLYRNGERVTYRESPNGAGIIKPRFLVIHFTAGFYEGAVSWMTQRQSGVSAHLCIGEEGQITQLAPLNRRCNHAGQSEWKGVQLLNGHSIGFELANLGQLSGGPGAYRFGNHKIPDSRVIRAAHRNGGPVTGWHTFTAAQIEASAGAARAVCQAYGIKEIVGHDDIAPKRKSDPGPAFDMAAFRKAVLG